MGEAQKVPTRLVKTQKEYLQEYQDSLGDRDYVTADAARHFLGVDEFWKDGQKESILFDGTCHLLMKLEKQLPPRPDASGKPVGRLKVLRTTEEGPSQWSAPTLPNLTWEDYRQKATYLWKLGDSNHEEAAKVLKLGMESLPTGEAKKLRKAFVDHPVSQWEWVWK